MSIINKYEINAKRILVFGDLHQQIDWARRILGKEKNNYDFLIILGDFFDSFFSPPRVAGAAETAKFVLEIQSGKYGPYFLCLGNHEMPVMESWHDNQKYKKRHLHYNCCSGYTNSKSLEVNKIFKWGNWRNFHVFCKCQDIIFSHAGFSSKYLEQYHISLDDNNLDNLWEETEDALEHISHGPSRIFDCGAARGGIHNVGGPLWADFNSEFTCVKDVSQVFGHSMVMAPTIAYFDKNKNTITNSYYSFNAWDHKEISYNLDCSQSYYGILENGRFTFKKLEGNPKLKRDIRVFDKVFEEFKQAEIDRLANLIKL